MPEVVTNLVAVKMLYEWDSNKATRNVEKHGVTFEMARRIFLDPNRLDFEDRRQDYRERRRLTFGLIENRLYVVAYTARGSVVRLISARKANARERKRHDKALQT